MSGDKTRIEKVIDQINAKNAKKIALVLVIGFVCYHGLLHIRYGNLRLCNRMPINTNFIRHQFVQMAFIGWQI